MMGSITQRRRKWKVKVGPRRKTIEERMRMLETDELDTRVALIQELIPIGLQAVGNDLQREVAELAGAKHKHGKVNVRWSRGQNGSVYLLDQKVPIKVPRVRNKLTNTEVPLSSYRMLQEPYRADKRVFKQLLNGLSMNKYAECAELTPQVFGLSASNMSRRFKCATAAKLRYLQTRSLRQYEFVAIFIDGKRLAEEGIVMAMGVTRDGKKIILGIEQMSTENHRAVGEFFDRLIARGLRYEEGILFIVDGSKGLDKAIRQKFAGFEVIQRCQWHKRENVVSYLAPEQQKIYRRRLKEAYNQTTYQEVKTALGKIESELEEINPSAAASLREGQEETLTLHRLGLHPELKRHFAHTSCLESVMAQVEQHTGRVDYWRGGTHRQRWVAASVLEIESQLRRIQGYRYLKLLRAKLRELTEQRRKKDALEAPVSHDSMAGIHNSTP